jgi:transcriptional regulator with XRE-family HTH domain
MLPEFSASAARMRSGVSSLVTIHMYRTCDTPVKGQSGRYPQQSATPVSFFAVTEDADRSEMQRLLAFANYSKVAEAIGVKRAAVANWAAGRHVTPGRLDQVRALYGITKEAAPSEEGAAVELLKRWSGDEPPPWAVMGRQQILEALESLRGDSMQAVADRIGTELAEELLPQLLAEQARESSRPPQGRPAKPARPRR